MTRVFTVKSNSTIVRDYTCKEEKYINLIKKHKLNIAYNKYEESGLIIYERIPPKINNKIEESLSNRFKIEMF